MQLVFATHNNNKLQEVRSLLPDSIELLSLDDIGCQAEIPETGKTLVENAKIKADFVTKTYGYNCFSDDTGLLVETLNGAPGVYSARYAGIDKNAEANMAKLLLALENENNRNAQFKTVIALNLNGSYVTFEGVVDGLIEHEQMGEKGFGYDPIFKPNGYDRTFAQLPLSVKNEIGHRGKAMEKLIYYLKTIG
ncbi:non-canonical purine NTP diphosphatase [Maribacter halichondriae]|uniref:non-canonical purine NTP diphosphatase n=1 Tax=Maribacter halichondriae TaxID=2980554 RepID=UPI002358BACA|nr:non-canonical purine NTP diphosphatase [Maribacter sp. Hal144]